MLEENSTVVVGRNNSGKTSLTDVFDRFISQSGARFRLEDFSAASRAKFFEAKTLRESGAKPEDVLTAFPMIALTLTFAYDVAAPNLGPLAPFVIDLDVACTKALVRVEYKPTLETLHTLLDVPTPGEGVEQTPTFSGHCATQFPRHTPYTSAPLIRRIKLIDVSLKESLHSRLSSNAISSEHSVPSTTLAKAMLT